MICDNRKAPGPDSLAGYDPLQDANGYFYDEEAAQKVVDFFAKGLKITSGAHAGEPFILQPWQDAYVRTLFGWKRTTGFRRYKLSYLQIPRKNGKSTLAAAIAIYVLFCDSEAEAQCYCAASNAEQATLVFRQAESFVRGTEWLADNCKIRTSQKRILYKDTSILRAIPANEGGSHGFNSHLIIGDELHAWPGRDFYDVLETSKLARTQPLSIYITTAGYDRTSICYEQYVRACQVRDREQSQPYFLPVVYEASEKDDWQDPETWKKANPNLDISIDRESLQELCDEAKRNPNFVNTFRRLHTNVWTQQETRWLDMECWRDCPTTEEDLDPQFCVGGLDMSAVADMTAFVWGCRDDESDASTFRCRGHYWLPEVKAREYQQAYNLPIDEWVERDILTLIPGRRIEQTYIERFIRELGVRTIGYDRYETERIRQDLEADGFTMIEIAQGFVSLSAPAKQLERLVLGRQIDHGSCPCLQWQAGNAVAVQDINGNVRPVKNHGAQKIDGIVALIMMLFVLQQSPPPYRSMYETPGMLSL